MVGDDGAHEGGGGHVERAIRGLRVRGAVRVLPNCSTSSASRSSIGMAAAAVGVQVDRGRGRSNVEGHLMSIGEHCKGVRADLVGHVAVGRDPVGTHDHDVDIAAREQRAGHRVGDDGVGNPEPIELPRGEPRALEQGPGLVDPDLHCLPDSAAARITPSAVPYPTVANDPVLQCVKHARRRRSGRHRTRRARGSRNVSVGDALRFHERRTAHRPRTRPGRVRPPREVHRGWPDPREATAAARTPAVGIVDAASATPYAPAAPRRGRATHRERSDRSHQLVDRRALEETEPVRQQTLVHQPHPSCRHSMVGGIGSRASHRRQCRTSETLRLGPERGADPLRATAPDGFRWYDDMPMRRGASVIEA